MTAALTAFYDEKQSQAEAVGEKFPSANDQTVLTAA
jgi:hypothetical protein